MNLSASHSSPLFTLGWPYAQPLANHTVHIMPCTAFAPRVSALTAPQWVGRYGLSHLLRRTPWPRLVLDYSQQFHTDPVTDIAKNRRWQYLWSYGRLLRQHKVCVCMCAFAHSHPSHILAVTVSLALKLFLTAKHRVKNLCLSSSTLYPCVTRSSRKSHPPKPPSYI